MPANHGLPVTEDEIVIMRHLRAQGWGTERIAREIGRSKTTVFNYTSTVLGKNPPGQIITAEVAAEIQRLYHVEMVRPLEISRRLKISKGAVYSRIGGVRSRIETGVIAFCQEKYQQGWHRAAIAAALGLTVGKIRKFVRGLPRPAKCWSRTLQLKAYYRAAA